jgi:transposase
MAAESLAAPGLTVRDVARRYRVSPDKVRGWIARGELPAVNTAAALCGKPRWVVTPDALASFERRRAGRPPPSRPRWPRQTSDRLRLLPRHDVGGQGASVTRRC